MEVKGHGGGRGLVGLPPCFCPATAVENNARSIIFIELYKIFA